jgi:flagellar basal-body rod modification protein FlgD
MDIGISVTQSPQEQAKIAEQVNTFNKTLNDGKGAKTTTALDKNDFLKILITQLTHQDPTQPLDDKEFVAQMAQFSSLEQMTNMTDSLTKVSDILSRSQAVSLLGSVVDVSNGDSTVTGYVDAVTGGDFPQLLVNGSYYDYAAVQKIKTSLKE